MNFAKEVKGRFRFLVDEYGYERPESGLSEVVYRKMDTAVRISYDRRAYESDFDFELIRNGQRETIGLPAIVRAHAPDAHLDPVSFQASSASAVPAQLDRMASLVRRVCPPLLLGNQDAIDRAIHLDKMQAQATTKMYSAAEQTRRQAAAAWMDKDYPKALRLYAAIRNDLSPLEEKRLAYLEKRGRS